MIKKETNTQRWFKIAKCDEENKTASCNKTGATLHWKTGEDPWRRRNLKPEKREGANHAKLWGRAFQPEETAGAKT